MTDCLQEAIRALSQSMTSLVDLWEELVKCCAEYNALAEELKRTHIEWACQRRYTSQQMAIRARAYNRQMIHEKARQVMNRRKRLPRYRMR